MKLTCSLVEDLYPLYEENELKPENRLAVEVHLQHCKNCSELYQKGTGFSEFPLSTEETLSDEIDGRIRLRFRLKRMKVIAALLAAVIIVSVINQYASNREKIATLLDGVYQYAETLDEIAKHPYELDSNRELLAFAAEDVGELGNHLNWLERKNAYHFLVNSQALDVMSETLNARNSQGLEDETDRAAIELLQDYTSTLFSQVEKEYKAFHHGYSSYFEIVDVEAIGTPIDKIDELTYFYNRYHKLPSEMKLREEGELKKILRAAFDAKDSKIEFEKTNGSLGVYRFNLIDGETKIDGEIDGFSGQISFASNYSHQLNEKKPMNWEVVREKAEGMLHAIYGESARFEITDEPTDAAVEGQPNLYKFRFTPLAGEYKLEFPFGNAFIIEFDAGTGEFFQFSAEPSLQSAEFFSKKFEERLTPSSLETKATTELSGEKVNAIGTGIIYSTVSADYVLVHIFEGAGNRVYINAETGVVEKPYFDTH